jgi:hypothetical protein
MAAAIAPSSKVGSSMSTITQYPPRLSPKPRPLRKHWRHLGFLARAACAQATPKEPLFIYTMGKVGTMSYQQALRESNRFNVFAIHFLNPRFRQEFALGKGNLLKPGAPLHMLGEQLLRRLFVQDTGRRCWIITGVRDPIAQLVSRFYHTFSDSFDITADAVDPLARWFAAGVDCSFPTAWFEREFQPVTGIDVFEHPFDQEQGWTVVRQRHLNCLILKLEIPDIEKTKAISAFLGIPDVVLSRRNVRAVKDPSGDYERFKARVALPDDVIDAVLGSRYSHHFYTEEERAEIRRRWRRAG